jgi:hypothetical protein
MPIWLRITFAFPFLCVLVGMMIKRIPLWLSIIGYVGLCFSAICLFIKIIEMSELATMVMGLVLSLALFRSGPIAEAAAYLTSIGAAKEKTAPAAQARGWSEGQKIV